jgi:hypothetical protein
VPGNATGKWEPEEWMPGERFRACEKIFIDGEILLKS